MNEEKRNLCIELLEWLKDEVDGASDVYINWKDSALSAEEVYNLFLEDKYL